MVRFPHWADRVIDDFARPLAALRAAGREVPEARAEVCSPEDRVKHEPGHQENRSGGTHPVVSFGLSAGSGGPYGVSVSSNPSCARARRLIPRNTRIVVTPSAA